MTLPKTTEQSLRLYTVGSSFSSCVLFHFNSFLFLRRAVPRINRKIYPIIRIRTRDNGNEVLDVLGSLWDFSLVNLPAGNVPDLQCRQTSARNKLWNPPYGVQFQPTNATKLETPLFSCCRFWYEILSCRKLLFCCIVTFHATHLQFGTN